MPLTSSLLAAGYQVGTGRAIPTLAAAVALVSIFAGVRATRRRSRTGAVVALAAAVAAVLVGGVHAATAAGGLGTGNGLAGAVLAVVLGAAGLIVGAVTLTRSP